MTGRMRLAARSTIGVLVCTLAGGTLSQESRVQLADGPGKDKASQCVACHSLDYIQMNAHFLDKAGWTASINKMINAFGAPIPREDVDAIATYLAEHYGKSGSK